MSLQKKYQQFELDKYLGEMKILCKETPLDSSSIAGVLKNICDVMNDPTAGQSLQKKAEKAYTKALARVPGDILDEVKSKLLIRPPVSLDETVLAQIRTEISMVRQFRELIVALYVLLQLFSKKV
jgi:hypothetical protein